MPKNSCVSLKDTYVFYVDLRELLSCFNIFILEQQILFVEWLISTVSSRDCAQSTNLGTFCDCKHFNIILWVNRMETYTALEKHTIRNNYLKFALSKALAECVFSPWGIFI